MTITTATSPRSAPATACSADLHEFTITPEGTALITAYQDVHWADRRKQDGLVQDGVVQEIDIPTGLVLFQWDSLDHVSLSDSHSAGAEDQQRPYDYFHLNSVQEAADGNLIVSGRNTWAAYDDRPSDRNGHVDARRQALQLQDGPRYQHRLSTQRA